MIKVNIDMSVETKKIIEFLLPDAVKFSLPGILLAAIFDSTKFVYQLDYT